MRIRVLQSRGAPGSLPFTLLSSGLWAGGWGPSSLLCPSLAISRVDSATCVGVQCRGPVLPVWEGAPEEFLPALLPRASGPQWSGGQGGTGEVYEAREHSGCPESQGARVREDGEVQPGSTWAVKLSTVLCTRVLYTILQQQEILWLKVVWDRSAAPQLSLRRAPMIRRPPALEHVLGVTI